MEIAQGIHRFDTGPFNWYIVKESGRFTLVDAGFPGHYGVFLDGLRSLGGSLADLDAILLTHAHADHTGFAERLRKITKAPVFVHRADAAMAGSVLQLPWVGLLSNAWRPFTAGMLTRAALRGVFTMPSIAKTYPIEGAGETLDVPGRPRAIHTPGHTGGHTMFYFPRSKALIAGDALVMVNLFTGERGVQLPADSLNHDSPQARRSLDKIAEIGGDSILLTGHGHPWQGDLRDAVKQARDRLP